MTALYVALATLFGFVVFALWRNDAARRWQATPLQTLILLGFATFIFGGYSILVMVKALLR